MAQLPPNRHSVTTQGTDPVVGYVSGAKALDGQIIHPNFRSLECQPLPKADHVQHVRLNIKIKDFEVRQIQHPSIMADIVPEYRPKAKKRARKKKEQEA